MEKILGRFLKFAEEVDEIKVRLVRKKEEKL
jgi:hypothetical protein